MRVVYHDTVFQNVSYGAAWQASDRDSAEKAAYEECKNNHGPGKCEEPGEMDSGRFGDYVRDGECIIVTHYNTDYGRHYVIGYAYLNEIMGDVGTVMCPK